MSNGCLDTADGLPVAGQQYAYKTLDASWIGDTNIRYMPFVGSTAATAPSGARVSMALPHDGRVVRIELVQNSGSTLGNADVTTHLGAAGAHPSAVATETESVNVAALDTSYELNYDSTTFSEGDRLAIGIDPANDPAGGFTMITLVLEFDPGT